MPLLDPPTILTTDPTVEAGAMARVAGTAQWEVLVTEVPEVLVVAEGVTAVEGAMEAGMAVDTGAEGVTGDLQEAIMVDIDVWRYHKWTFPGVFFHLFPSVLHASIVTANLLYLLYQLLSPRALLTLI